MPLLEQMEFHILNEESIRNPRRSNLVGAGQQVEEDNNNSSRSVSFVPAPKVYVAIGQSWKKNRRNLLWSLQKFGAGAKFVILHILQHAQTVPGPVGARMVSSLRPEELKAFRQMEKQKAAEGLNEYLQIFTCQRADVELIIMHAEDVQKGLVEAVTKYDIQKLIMGAAADTYSSKKMKKPSSKKASYVSRYALPSCKIWFICKGGHVFVREASVPEPSSLASQVSPSRDTNPRFQMPERSFSVSESSARQKTRLSGCHSSINAELPGLAPTPSPLAEVIGSQRLSGDAENYDSGSEAVSTSLSHSLSNNSSDVISVTNEEAVGSPMSYSTSLDYVQESATLESDSERAAAMDSEETDEEDHKELGELFDRLKKAMDEAKMSKEEAFKESRLRQKAEQDVVEAMNKARYVEISFAKEQRRRKETEDELLKERAKLEELETQERNITSELNRLALGKCSLETRVTDLDREKKEILEKLWAAQLSLVQAEKEKLEMMQQRDDANEKVDQILTKPAAPEASSSPTAVFSFTEFSLSELAEATNGFDPENKIGEGGFGLVYKATIRYTTVAVKILNAESMQGGREFHQEVSILSRLRHPHLVTLIGTCTEARALVYEYLPNGSLEDRLQCKNGTPPLAWQARTRIASEICSALLFLHSANVVHGDLKPANILLDSNLSVRIGDFGLCRLLPEQGSTISLCVNTDPKGTFAYMDPEFLATGDLTPKSDVYSFGVIILQLLTGKPALWISKEVQKAVTNGNLQSLLDTTAGEWPFVQAVQLANLALECCQMSKIKRPDLGSEIWKVLEPMRSSSEPSPGPQTSEERKQPPAYFMCPIFQEIMRDPHVAADGFTYEAEALRGWLDSGHDTSPMTNLKLPHLNLTPNHALRSAIQEWLQKS